MRGCLGIGFLEIFMGGLESFLVLEDRLGYFVNQVFRHFVSGDEQGAAHYRVDVLVKVLVGGLGDGAGAEIGIGGQQFFQLIFLERKQFDVAGAHHVGYLGASFACCVDMDVGPVGFQEFGRFFTGSVDRFVICLGNAEHGQDFVVIDFNPAGDGTYGYSLAFDVGDVIDAGILADQDMERVKINGSDAFDFRDRSAFERALPFVGIRQGFRLHQRHFDLALIEKIAIFRRTAGAGHWT